MGRKGRLTAVLAGLALVASVAATAAFGAHRADPGVTATTIKIGGTFPLTGVASLYKTIPAAEGAYFAYVNAHGGVNGRKIDFKIYDDAYNPANTVPLTKKLVEEDKVFAVYGSLGTAPTLATRDYLNERKVPQVLVATGDSYWGSQYKKYPWTIGFQPDYPGESRVYGQFIRTKIPQAKIGVLMQDDAYGQNYYAGLLQGLGAAKSKIVDTEKYDSTQTDVSSQIVKLKSSGANVFCLFALPTQTIGGLGSLWGVIVGAVFVQLLPTGLSSTHALRAHEAAPVIFGAILIIAMILVPRGAADLLRAAVRPLTSGLASTSKSVPSEMED